MKEVHLHVHLLKSNLLKTCDITFERCTTKCTS